MSANPVYLEKDHGNADEELSPEALLVRTALVEKGLETPMLVILIGALGGMMLQGILGLFIGPVVLALGYQIYTTWVEEGSEKPKTTEG